MPIYDYRCEKCRATFEKLLKLTEIDDYEPGTEFECCEEQDLKRYLPSKGAAKFNPSPMWRRHGRKGSW